MKYPFLRLLMPAVGLVVSGQILAADTWYVTDQLKAGLHEEKSLDSPIIKIVPTGTGLEIVKREESVSFVKEAGGASGWIDNSYLVETKPGGNSPSNNTGRVQALEKELKQAKSRIETLIAQTGPVQEDAKIATLREQKQQAEQQYKSERIKVGELEVQMAELRKRLGQDNNADTLYKKIDKLTEENKQLEIQLARAKDNPGQVTSNGPETSSSGSASAVSTYWRNVFIAFFVTMVIGVGLGIYIMDVVNRRRHGGFRV